MPVAFSNIMKEADIISGAATVKKSVKTYRERVVFLCMSTLNKWAKDGDVQCATRLAATILDAVDGAHKQKVVNWFGKFAEFRLNDDEVSFSYTKTKVSVEEVQAAREKNVWEFTPDNPPKPFNMFDKLDQLISAIDTRRSSKKRTNDDVIVSEAVEQLRKIAALRPETVESTATGTEIAA